MFYMGSLMIALAVEESGNKKPAKNMNIIILYFLTGYTRPNNHIQDQMQSIKFLITMIIMILNV